MNMRSQVPPDQFKTGKGLKTTAITKHVSYLLLQHPPLLPGFLLPTKGPSDHPTAVTLQLLLLEKRQSRDEVCYVLWDPFITHLQKFGYVSSNFLWYHHQCWWHSEPSPALCQAVHPCRSWHLKAQSDTQRSSAAGHSTSTGHQDLWSVLVDPTHLTEICFSSHVQPHGFKS